MDNKIKIRVTHDIYLKLLDDAELFGYYKKNGTINRNAFLNDLIGNYFYEFRKENEILQKQVYLALNNHKVLNSKEVTDEIIKIMRDNRNSNEKKKVINYTANKHILSLLETVIQNDELLAVAMSSYLHNLFVSYFQMPRYNREKIMFPETIRLLNKAIKDKKVITFTSIYSKNRFEIEPYKIASSRDEKCNYLYGYNKKEDRVSTFRISRISGLYITEENMCINSNIVDEINGYIQNNPSTSEKGALIKVRFTDIGKRKYEMITNNRPRLKHKDNNIYVFESPLLQVEEYLKRFGEEAYVIEPIELQNKLRDFYKNGFSAYNREG